MPDRPCAHRDDGHRTGGWVRSARAGLLVEQADGEGPRRAIVRCGDDPRSSGSPFLHKDRCEIECLHVNQPLIRQLKRGDDLQGQETEGHQGIVQR